MKTAVLLVVSFTWSLACRGADDVKLNDVKPGLWERTVTTEAQVSEETYAKMSAPDRAAYEAMIKSRNGVPAIAKVCLTHESMGKPFSIPGQNCTSKLVRSSDSRQEIHFECPSARHPSSGDVVVEQVDPDHLIGTMTMKTSADDSSAGGGGADSIKMTVSDKWLSTECGSIKPHSAKPGANQP